jgi:hypothetical protein
MQSKSRPATRLSRRRFLRLAGGALGAMAVGCMPKTPAAEETALPDYVDGGIGIPVFRGPYLQQEAHIAAFLLPARIEALRTLCNTYFSTPSNEAVKVSPLGPYVLLLYAEMQIQSLDERDEAIGWMHETEVSFWTPVTSGAGHAAWFLPYLFVDNPYAITSGREVYGFPKTWGQFEKPASIQNPEFAVDVWGFTDFDPQAEGTVQRLLETRKSDAAQDTPPETWTSWDAARSALIRLLFKDWEPQAGNGTQWFEMLEKMLTDADIRLLFLKQFRDAVDSRKACYQAIVEAPVQLTTFHSGGFIDADYTITCQPLASHPLPEILGLDVDSSSAMQALATFWLHVDFTLGPGVEVWRKT